MVVVVLGGEADTTERLQGALADPAGVATGQRLEDLVEPPRRRSIEDHGLTRDGFDGGAVGSGPRQEVPDGLERSDGLTELLTGAPVLTARSASASRIQSFTDCSAAHSNLVNVARGPSGTPASCERRPS